MTTDTTEFKYYEINNKGSVIMKKLYLDPFMDLFNISYSITMKPSAKGILDTLNEAIDTTSACKYRRTFHLDQG
jgi:hypothetical protein